MVIKAIIPVQGPSGKAGAKGSEGAIAARVCLVFFYNCFATIVVPYVADNGDDQCR